ncbi:unnamed protein product [Penicillium nalgiovense]|nr:unnamed protein product [Penicillium nalgiovense]CAG8189101.1 unnamed protein product [Penicillium nalgiovense]CAG8190552.1 unnamed protein product [Penicillium nalgiovense]
MPLVLYTTEKQFIKMPKLLSRIARKLGVLGGYIIIVRKNSGSIRVIESKFPSDSIIDVDVHLSMPYDYRTQGSNSHPYQKGIA